MDEYQPGDKLRSLDGDVYIFVTYGESGEVIARSEKTGITWHLYDEGRFARVSQKRSSYLQYFL